MYITNIKHLLNASRKMADIMPEEARDLVGFIIQIIDTTTKTAPHTLTATTVRCFRKACDGTIKTAIRPDTEEIHWFCPDCENEGLINSWQGSEWDNRTPHK